MIQFRPLRADEIDCRIATISEKGLSLLLYKDARADMRLLDETIGPLNWKRSHQLIDGDLYCTIEIWDAEKQQWISKQDVGTENYTEKEKSRASDSCKRACFNWGIGRELYTAPFIWIFPNDCTLVKNKDGKFSCYDQFKVERLEITDGVITALSIRNEGKGFNRTVFTYDAKAKKPAAAKKPAEKEERPVPVTISAEMFTVLQNLCKQKNVSAKAILEKYRITNPSEMLVTDWKAIIDKLKGLPDAQ